MASKLEAQPRRVARWLYGRLPWYGKILVPLVAIASGLRLLDWMVNLFI